MYSGKKAQYDFPKMRGGGGQRPFGTFPKIHPFWYSRPSLSMESRYIGICLIIGKIIDIDIIVLVLLVLLILPKFVGDLKDISAKCWKWRKIYRKDDRYQKIYLSPNPTHNPVYRSWSVGFTIDPYLIFVTCTTCGAGVKFFSLVSKNLEITFLRFFVVINPALVFLLVSNLSWRWCWCQQNYSSLNHHQSSLNHHRRRT